MISMLLFILTAFAPLPVRRYMRMGPHMVSLHAKVDDAMSQISTDDGTSSIGSELDCTERTPKFSSTWDALDTDCTKILDDAEAKKFFTKRNATKGNAFGSTVIVNLHDDVAKENETLAKHIVKFRAQLKAIPDSGEYLDFQENPHMTVSAVIMDRNVDEIVANNKFETANTDVKTIEEALRTIEDKNVTLKVEAKKALKLTNKEGQFSIQFDGTNTTTADLKKMEDDVILNLMKRFNSELETIGDEDMLKRAKDMLSRTVNGLNKIETWKTEPKSSMTEFQKIRFELIEKVGADVKDHFPAMALHIGQIKDPEALKRSEYQEEVAKLFADYKSKFAQCTITMKGLQYVRYTSNSLRPNSIEVLADGKRN